MSLFERSLAVWTAHWQRLTLAHLVSLLVPATVAAMVGWPMGLFSAGLLSGVDALTYGDSGFWEATLTDPAIRSAAVLVLAVFLGLTLLGSAGRLGVLRAILHEGRPPTTDDFIGGIKEYGARLLWLRLLMTGAGGLVALAAFLVTIVAGWLLTSWLVPLVVILFILLGLGSLLYADLILVIEKDCTAWEAISGSVEVLFRRWQEVLTAVLMVGLLRLVQELGAKLFALMGAPGLIPTLLLSAVISGVVMLYLAVRYIVNVHRALYDRQDPFSIG